MKIDPHLLEVLACPACKSGLSEADGWLLCSNSSCGLRYPVKDGIPVMLIEEAKKA